MSFAGSSMPAPHDPSPFPAARSADPPRTSSSNPSAEMDSLEFLQAFPPAGASITVTAPDGSVSTIHGVDPIIIGQRCPLLQLSFETSAYGSVKASIEASSVTVVTSFLRFLYLGEYMVWHDYHETACSLLLHAELCRMADVFEVPELQVAAHANIIRETELSCSRPQPPIDLCAAIRFIYTHLSSQRPLIDTLLNYCLACFVYHGLGSDDTFRQLAFELTPFHRDLCRTNYHRMFKDEGATDIVRLPVCKPNEHSEAENGRAALGDFLWHLWCDDTQPEGVDETPERKRRRLYRRTEPSYTFVHRPKPPGVVSGEHVGSSSSEEDAGFTLVHRPKLREPEGTVLSMESSESDTADTEEERDEQPDLKDSSSQESKHLADSYPIIKPETGEPATEQSAKLKVEDDQYSSDSDWSVVSGPVQPHSVL